MLSFKTQNQLIAEINSVDPKRKRRLTKINARHFMPDPFLFMA
jgi:hypothetical protein